MIQVTIRQPKSNNASHTDLAVNSKMFHCAPVSPTLYSTKKLDNQIHGGNFIKS